MKSEAKYRDTKWNIDFDYFLKLIYGKCFYCGADPEQKYNRFLNNDGKHKNKNSKKTTFHAKSAWIKYNGIDRIDSMLDYTSQNVVSCCVWCNRAKNSMSIDDFLSWLKLALDYQKTKSVNFINENMTENSVFNKFEIKSYKYLFLQFKSTSKQRKIEFTLSLQEMIYWVTRPCFYCGSKPDNIYNAHITKSGNIRKSRGLKKRYYYEKFWIKYTGMDRLNSSIGYISDNVVSCCKKCNLAKSSRTKDEFISWLMIFTNRLDFIKFQYQEMFKISNIGAV